MNLTGSDTLAGAVRSGRISRLAKLDTSRRNRFPHRAATGPMSPWLTHSAPFPAVERALTEPNGLLAAGGDLSAGRLITAYARGIFPWFSDGQPVLWWSPDPRMVLMTGDFKVSRSLRSRLRSGTYTVTTDTDFSGVVGGCASVPRAGQDGTWINGQMIRAYTCLHELGYAHSVEAWLDGELVGGLYGLAIGRVFFGESMFARRTDASKVALSALMQLLRDHDVPLVDGQQ